MGHKGLPGQTIFPASGRTYEGPLSKEWGEARASPATLSGHTHAWSLPRAPGFARRSQTPLLHRDGPQLASSHPHSFPLGLPGGLSTDRGPFATGPCFSRRGQGSGFSGCIIGPANCFPPTSLAQLNLQQSFLAGSPSPAKRRAGNSLYTQGESKGGRKEGQTETGLPLSPPHHHLLQLHSPTPGLWAWEPLGIMGKAGNHLRGPTLRHWGSVARSVRLCPGEGPHGLEADCEHVLSEARDPAQAQEPHALQRAHDHGRIHTHTQAGVGFRDLLPGPSHCPPPSVESPKFEPP